MLEVTKATYIGNYTIRLVFNNGMEGNANLHDFIFNDRRTAFVPLQNESAFKNFKLEHSTVVWSDELDLAPEYLFFLAFKDKPDLQEQFISWGYITSPNYSTGGIIS